MSEFAELIDDFLAESKEELDRVEQDAVRLERDREDQAVIAPMFRALHTLKGNCGLFGFRALEGLAHAGEELLSRLRDRVRAPSAADVDALLELVDKAQAMLADIAELRAEGPIDPAALIGRLERLADEVEEPLEAADSEPLESEDNALFTSGVFDFSEFIAEADPPPKEPSEPPREGARRLAIEEGTLRLDVRVIDELMNLVGELVLGRNRLVGVAAGIESPALAAACQQLSAVTTQIQSRIAKARMQPISRLWTKLPRLVRDLSQVCDKRLRLELFGGETELDRKLIEMLRDPLTHLVRNAVDHGFESEDERRRLGKAEQGTLRVGAYHESGEVHVVVEDDGAGLDAARLRERGLAAGLISPDESEDMSEAEVYELIFVPGFSTSESVTTVSGRGIGMDVVRSSLEGLGGAVSLETRPGAGTRFTLTIPLTLAIIPALIAASGPHRFAIPRAHILELVRARAGDRSAIRRVGDRRVLELRQELLPIIELDRRLGLSSDDGSTAGQIVVIEAEDRRVGLAVDGVQDAREIVVKPLDDLLRRLRLYSGSTILDEGEVALVLDVRALVGATGPRRGPRSRRSSTRSEALSPTQPCPPLLVFRIGGRRMAVALEMVWRLHELRLDAVEDQAGQAVVRLEDRLVPVISLPDIFDVESQRDDSSDAGFAPMVIGRHGGRRLGLIVDAILDIADEPYQVQAKDYRDGIRGTALIGGAATDLLDIRELVEGSRIELYDEPAPPGDEPWLRGEGPG